MIHATIGFAADEHGRGLAYARLRGRGGSKVLRLPFELKGNSELLEREVGYAALNVVAERLRAGGAERVSFAIDDPQLVSDLGEHREIPPALNLAYVRLGCALNQFREHRIARTRGSAADLTARAKAEIAMLIAA